MATVFGMSWSYFNRLSSKRKNHYRRILRIITWQAEGRTCWKTATFAEKENPVSVRQCTVSHLSCCHGENPRIVVWTALPYTLLTRSIPKRLLFVLSSKNCARRTEIFVKWRGIHLREQLFCREKRRVLFGRVTEMWASLGEVCRVTRRLCWKFKKFS